MFHCNIPRFMNLGRKTSLLISWLVLCSPCIVLSQGYPGITDLRKDSLQYFLGQRNYDLYFKLIRKIFNDEVRLALKDNIISAEEKSQLLQFVQPLLKGYPGMSDESTHRLRESCMFVGNRAMKKMNDYNTALIYYERAHQALKNPQELDSNAWFIENEILNIYTRVGDYENALIYISPMESGLIRDHAEDRLSRFYTNVGLMFQNLGNLDKAIDYYTKGLVISERIEYNIGKSSNLIGLAQIYIDQGKLVEA
jgi:tetratricopeptide (TPR) repeat protein